MDTLVWIVLAVVVVVVLVAFALVSRRHGRAGGVLVAPARRGRRRDRGTR